MKRLLTLIVLLFSYYNYLSGGVWVAPSKLTFEYQESYYNNVFRYSVRDIQRFDQRQYPWIESLDDYVSQLALELQWKINSRETLLKLNLSHYWFLENRNKTYLKGNFYLRRYLNRRDYVEFRYFVMPDYFLRYYRDRESVWGASHPCTYGDQRFILKFSLHGGYRHTYQILAGLQNLYFNERFTEYDQNIYWLGLNYYRGFSGLRKVGVLTTFVYSDNVNKSHLSDLSYGEYRAGISLSQRGIRIFRRALRLSAGFTIRYRVYLSENLPREDRFHSGRISLRTAVLFQTRYQIFPSTLLSMALRHEQRRILQGAEVVKRVKEFQLWVISSGVKFEF